MKKSNLILIVLFSISLSGMAQTNPNTNPQPNNANINRSRSNIKQQIATFTTLSSSYYLLNMQVGSNDENYLSNMQQITSNFTTPLIKKQKIAFGLNAEIGYAFGNSTPSKDLPTNINVFGQTYSTVSRETSSANNSVIFASVGPVAMIGLSEKFSIKPRINVGLMSLNQAGVNAVQTTKIGNESYNFNLIEKPSLKRNELIFKPAFQLNYNLSKSIGIFAEAAYLFGTEKKSNATSFSPYGKPNDGNFTLEQIQNGRFSKNSSEESGIKAASFGLGINITLSGKQAISNANINRSRSNIKGK